MCSYQLISLIILDKYKFIHHCSFVIVVESSYYILVLVFLYFNRALHSARQLKPEAADDYSQSAFSCHVILADSAALSALIGQPADLVKFMNSTNVTLLLHQRDRDDTFRHIVGIFYFKILKFY